MDFIYNLKDDLEPLTLCWTGVILVGTELKWGIVTKMVTWQPFLYLTQNARKHRK